MNAGSEPTPERGGVERELRSILIRFLPVGLEGVGRAQAKAVVELISRRSSQAGHPPPPPPPAPSQQGLMVLAEVSREHALLADVTRGGVGVCRLCRTHTGVMESWPCRVWVSAQLLGVADAKVAPGRSNRKK